MKKIDEMIKQLCPNGVEYKPIGDIMYVSDYVSAGSFASIRENVQYLSEPNYAILLRFADFSSGFDPEKFVYVNEKAYNYLNKSNLQPGDIVMSNVGSCGLLFACPDLGKPMTLAPNSIVIKTLNNRFYFHWLSSKVAQNEIEKIKSKSAMPKFNKTDFKKILAPIPPLSIQEEIVSILDKFSELIEKTDEEIALRQKQYEYYREKLLTFEDGGVKRVEMGKVAMINRGKRVVRQELSEKGRIPVFQNSLRPLGFHFESNYPAGTPFVISAGAAGEVGFSDVPFWAADDCLAFSCKKDVNGKYIYHYLKIKEQFLKNQIRGGAIKRLSRDIVENLEIPIPSPSRQQSIVATLDKFEALISKLKEERELRQKQYEYYREKLLTF